LIANILKLIFRNFPIIKGKLWKSWYTYLGSKVISPDLRFMNYGYFSNDFHPTLSMKDESERYPIHLYHYLCSKIELENLNILEVGSGRGGGADYISRIFKPKKVAAVDISKSAIELCNKFYNRQNLEFVCGDSEDLPFDKESFDVVLNVESSHCYPSFDNFLKEVARVLKPSSYFLFTDFRPSNDLESLNKSINNYFDVYSKEEITTNVISALDLMSEKRAKQIENFLPSFLSHISLSFAGVKGSDLYESFVKKDLRYYMYVLKPKYCEK